MRKKKRKKTVTNFLIVIRAKYIFRSHEKELVAPLILKLVTFPYVRKGEISLCLIK
jgi:hypothetical protein